MRTIKFRAWDKDGKKWIDPERVYIGANGDLLSYGSSDDTGGFDTEIDIQFFTGLTDKNGKEIYEGDILGWDTNGRAVEVIWKNYGWSAGGWSLQVWEPAMTEIIGNIIIGNIYSNPELINHPTN